MFKLENLFGLILLLGLSCTTLHVQIPQDAHITGKKAVVTSFPGILNKDPIIFAPFRVSQIHVGWSTGRTKKHEQFKLTQSEAESSQEFQFESQCDGLPMSAATQCKRRDQSSEAATQSKIGTFSVGHSDRWTYCTFAVSGQAYELLVESTDSIEKGTLRTPQGTFVIEPVKESAEGTKTPWSLGYRFLAQNRTLAVVQTSGERSFWYLEDQSSEQKLALATSAAALMIAETQSSERSTNP